MAGDFNIVLDVSKDRLSGIASQPNEAISTRLFDSLLETNGPSDVYPSVYPTTRGFTWRRPNARHMSRIDYVLVSNDIARYHTASDVCPWQ